MHRSRALLIGGAGHSGSTLLGMILGSHPDVFYAGEAAKTRFLGDPSKPLRKRVCKLCGPACPIWGDFIPDPAEELYAQLARRSGRSRVVDSSKNLDWIRSRVEALGAERPVFVFLQRDGRAVVNSRVRKYPDRDPVRLIEDWVERIGETQDFFDTYPGPKRVVRYERLATDPEREVRPLVELLGLTYDPQMLAFQTQEQHPLGGNNGTQYQVAREQGGGFVRLGERGAGYYGGHPRGIVLDERWRTELTAPVLATFDAIAAGANEALRWDGADRRGEA